MDHTDQPTIRKFVDLSTAHLPQHVLAELTSFNGVIAHPTPHGAWLWVPDDPQSYTDDYAADFRAGEADGDDFGDGSAPEILVVQLYARSLGCDYVLFDRDADIDDALPTWDW